MAKKIPPLADKTIKYALSLQLKKLQKKEIKEKKIKESTITAVTKQFTLFDGDGLFLVVMPDNSKYWRFKYRFAGKEKVMALAPYAELTLEKAREKRKELRDKVRAGIDPAAEKKQQKVDKKTAAAGIVIDDPNSFKNIAKRWHKKNYSRWSPKYADLILHRLERDVFNDIGSISMSKLKRGYIADVLEKIEARTIETAHLIKSYIVEICRYAVTLGIIEVNPAGDLKGLLVPSPEKNYPAITKPDDLAILLKKIADYSYRMNITTRFALRLAVMLFIRPAELSELVWSEVDFSNRRLDIPAGRMKRKIAFYVPLSTQAIEILEILYRDAQGRECVFPGDKNNEYMSNGAINKALTRLGYKGIATGHGFRATARTVGREILYLPEKLLEIQLAHKTMSPNGTAYDRVAFLPERHKMMQVWSDFLDDLEFNRTPKKNWIYYLPKKIQRDYMMMQL